MLKYRVITAVILALIAAGTILFLETLYVAILFLILLFLAMRELINLTISEKLVIQLFIASLFTAAFVISLFYMELSHHYLQLYVADLMWVIVTIGLFFYRFSGQNSALVKLLQWIFAGLLLWFCVHALLLIHLHIPQGGWMLMYLLTLVWVADIGAYFAGRKFGKHKLAPSISPGKTWQGVAGGLVLNVLWISIVYQLSDGWGLGFGYFLMLGLVTSMISVVGDLYESILKREAGQKDSGVLLPGHGGVLDRLDSIIAAAPVFVTGLYLAGMI